MTVKTIKTVVAVTFLPILFIVVLVSVAHPQTMYDVRVINGFKSNSSMPLIVWCSSEDTDLGGRALQEGDDFGWTLWTHLWATHHFLCTVKWDLRKRRFDAFVAGRDRARCGPLRKCCWLVKEDGFYFSSDEIKWNKDFSWIY